MLRQSISAVVLCVLVTGTTRALAAQSATISVTSQRWTLGTPLGDSARVESAQQLVVPVEGRLRFGERWSMDANAAFTKGKVTFLTAANSPVTRELSGATDVRLRANGSFMNDGLSLALGVNVPTGHTKLDVEELAALRVLAAPAAGMPAPVLGTGFGATIGAIVARRVGDWAIAGGATYEQRGEYAASEQLSAGLSVPTRVKPGPAAHVSLGATGDVRNGEMALYFTTDLFGTDALKVDALPAPVQTEYRLGPMFSVNWSFRPGFQRVPDLQLMAGVRVRSEYEDDVVGKVPGSGGTVANAGVSGTLWRKGSWRLRTALEARTFSGLDVDSTFVTAAFTDVGVSATLSIPVGRSSFDPFVRINTGTVDLGPAKSSTRSIAIGGRIHVR